MTITPTGHGDADSDALYYYCNETGTAGGQAPTSANTLCSQANGSNASPYSSMSCTYAVATGDTTRTVYCRTYDGTDYSTERSTTYVVDTTAPVITITNPNTSAASSKTIIASVSDGTLTMSNTTGVTCDGSLTFIAYSSQTFTSESDNGTKVCYKATDAVGNIGYSMSNAIAGIDRTGPTATSIVSDPSKTSATITWTTAEAGSSQIEYGPTASYGNTTTETDASSRVTSHAASLSDLTCGTTYHFRALSTDAQANQGASSDQTFQTTNCDPGGGAAATQSWKDFWILYDQEHAGNAASSQASAASSSSQVFDPHLGSTHSAASSSTRSVQPPRVLSPKEVRLQQRIQRNAAPTQQSSLTPPASFGGPSTLTDRAALRKEERLLKIQDMLQRAKERRKRRGG